MGERRRSWVSPDLCIDLSHYSAGCALGRHQHNDAFFCFVIDGTYEERANGLREVLPSGSLVYHPAGREHSNQWHEDGRCLHVEFASTFYAGMNQVGLADPVRQIIGGRAGDIVRSVYKELLHIDSASGIAFEGLAMLLLAESIREASRESTAPRWLRSVRDRLQDEYVAVPPLRVIAVEVGVHPTYLAASFQKHFGVSVGEFVRLRRIERAREMLSHTEQQLSEVALLLGFSDQSHFCRTFKKQTGLSPLEYRRLFPRNLKPVQKS